MLHSPLGGTVSPPSRQDAASSLARLLCLGRKGMDWHRFRNEVSSWNRSLSAKCVAEKFLLNTRHWGTAASSFDSSLSIFEILLGTIRRRVLLTWNSLTLESSKRFGGIRLGNAGSRDPDSPPPDRDPPARIISPETAIDPGSMVRQCFRRTNCSVYFFVLILYYIEPLLAIMELAVSFNCWRVRRKSQASAVTIVPWNRCSYFCGSQLRR